MWLIKHLKKRKKEKKRRNSVRGFTLIELLVAASILGLIGLAILTTFGSGFHVYERIQSYGGVQADVLLALEEMERDLRNIFPSSVIPFEGDDQSIRFPAVIEALQQVEGEETVVFSLGQMSYYVESTHEEGAVLIQEQLGYSRALSGMKAGEGREHVLTSVKDLKFSYYAFDGEEGTYGWEDTWPAEKKSHPAGVRIELTFHDGSRDIQLVRTVVIPSIRVEEEIEDGEEEGEEEGEGQGDV